MIKKKIFLFIFKKEFEESYNKLNVGYKRKVNKIEMDKYKRHLSRAKTICCKVYTRCSSAPSEILRIGWHEWISKSLPSCPRSFMWWPTPMQLTNRHFQVYTWNAWTRWRESMVLWILRMNITTKSGEPKKWDDFCSVLVWTVRTNLFMYILRHCFAGKGYDEHGEKWNL